MEIISWQKKQKMTLSAIFLGVSAIFILTGCVAQKEAAAIHPSYTIDYISNSDNDFEGNLIIEIQNSNDEGLEGCQVSLSSKGKFISKMDIEDTFIGVFTTDNITFMVKTKKEGYLDVQTDKIRAKKGYACHLNIKMLAIE